MVTVLSFLKSLCRYQLSQKTLNVSNEGKSQNKRKKIGSGNSYPKLF